MHKYHLKILITCQFFYTFTNIIISQNLRNTFFDFKQDSLKSRQTQFSVPINGMTTGISNSLVTDYIGNTRVLINTSILAAKNDTFLAIHSLFNGIGNFTFEVETPIYYLPLTTQKVNFLGLSFNPRTSTLINTGSLFEKSSLNIDFGINTILKIQGELGNLSAKLIFRNALSWGNYQFINKIYNIESKLFYYNSIQIRLKANNNIFTINSPLILMTLNAKEISGFPVYAGFGFNF